MPHAHPFGAGRTAPRSGTRVALCLPLLLAACGGGHGARLGYASRDYTAPGSATDPWGPYIHEAAGRFSVPDAWVRAVMHQESGGHEYLDGRPVTSGAGAMGLMQLMPQTYADLQAQYGLGPDPYEPHDNIMAGTAYIRQMYDKYGSPGFLAAYNAGPARLDDFLAGQRNLPNETVNYVASIAPHLGTQVAMSGPLASYGAGANSADDVAPATASATASAAAPVRLAAYRPAPVRQWRGSAHAGCTQSVDAAYDPGSPCQPAPPVPNEVAGETEVAEASPMAAAGGSNVYYQPARYQIAAARPGCPGNPDAAFDSPCPAAAPPPAAAGYRVSGQALPVPGYRGAGPSIVPQAAAYRAAVPAPSYGGWSIQVGAFDSVGQARFATTMARQAAYRQLAAAQSVVQPTTPLGRATLYRARLNGLARDGAGAACTALKAQNIACMVVPPGA